MIKTFLVIVGGIVFLEILIDCIKAIQDDYPDNTFEYCHNCPHGFCFENPKTEKCKKWVESKTDM